MEVYEESSCGLSKEITGPLPGEAEEEHGK